MHVETSRFGTIEVIDDDVVRFPDGLPGFGGERRMVLLGGGELPGAAQADGVHTLYWLQDVDDPDLAFLTIVPWSAYPDYDIEVPATEIEADPEDLCVLAIVTVRRENGAVRLTSNLLAPIAIDTARQVGRQVILDDQSWPIHAPLAEAGPTDETGVA